MSRLSTSGWQHVLTAVYITAVCSAVLCCPAGSDRELTPYNSSQFPLLEETEPDQPTQNMQDQAALGRTTRVALR